VNTLLWVLQSLLAAAFLASAGMKLGLPHDALAGKLPWVSSVPVWLPRFIGVAEFLGSLGLILPAATRVLPWLTPLAAASLALLGLLALGVHLARHEPALGLPAAVLCLLCALVAGGRAWFVPGR
jgi:hypothetical protein